MDDTARILHPVPEHDDDTVSDISTARRSLVSPPSSTNPFSVPSIFQRPGSYQRMGDEHGEELRNLGTRGSSSVDELGISARSPPQSFNPFDDYSGTPGTLGVASPPYSAQDAAYASGSIDGRRHLASPQPGWDADRKETGGGAIYDSESPFPQEALYDDPRSTARGASYGPETPGLSVPGQSTPGDLNPNNDFPEDEHDDHSFNRKYREPPSYCSSRQDIHRPRSSWVSITIFVLSVYSTLASGLWLVVAILQPRYGHRISSNSKMSPSNATLVATLIAKTIEMSFVTVFISCLGQVLTRRAFIRKATGMTIAEMTMRNWILQPGSLLTHFETLPYAGVTILGALTLAATLAATLYTTASDAMVSPKLKYGDWMNKELTGFVKASYANAEYIELDCPSLLDKIDSAHADESCVNVEFSGQSYRNLLGFMTTWNGFANNGTSVPQDLKQRPVATALLYDNTTMISSWIETQHSNVTAQYEQTGRIINNVTMALPHPGVYEAATNPVNGILQPDDLNGVGEYSVKAGVVSPAVNVMCVNMSPDELKPLVYTAWKDALVNKTGVGNQTAGYEKWETDVPTYYDENGDPYWGNRTDVDDIFRWGPDYQRRPPFFQLYPSDFNLLTNATVYNSTAIYMLGKAPDFTNYTLCELRSWVSPNCSTQFNISGLAGATMKAHCEDPDDKDSYLKSFPTNQSWGGPSTDWTFLADEWSLSMDLNGGATNNNASNARILTQLALQDSKLSSSLPSMAEALAAYISALEVISAIGSPYRHYWDFNASATSDNIVHNNTGFPQAFNASLVTEEYTSGHTQNWQAAFYVVLGLVFAINLFCMFYFIMRSGLVTDFTEPQNLFALSINSPPSMQINGSCGGGPQNRDLVVPWRIAYAPSANHYFFEEANERPWRGKYSEHAVSTSRHWGEGQGLSYKRLSSSKGWL